MTEEEKKSRARVLLVEDDRHFLCLLREEFEERGHDVIQAENLARARRVFRESGAVPDIVVSDLKLPDGSGEALLEEAGQCVPAPAFIVLTAFGTIPQAVQILKEGADNFLTKPLDFEHLHISVERALEHRRLRLELDRLTGAGTDGEELFHGMLGKSPKMRRLIYELRKVASTEEPVLLHGESGTGKELAAVAIHRESPRAEGPFVPINCAAIPAELIESELFGHEKGAFTGATAKKDGLFVAAEGGSLFLDEIGDLSLDLQAKLLRVLQEGRVRPVGAAREVSVDVRIIAATHRDLRTEFGAGRFREDLFYRLEALLVTLPPLRERGPDVEMLALRLLRQTADAMGKAAPEFEPAVIEAFHRYPFPGNIRELENVIKKMLVFADGSAPLGPDSLPDPLKSALERKSAPSESPAANGAFVVEDPLPELEVVRRRYVRHVLDATGGNKRKAAEWLGIGRRTLYDLLERQEERRE